MSASPHWLRQAAWEINSSSGNDSNTGAPGDPIKTWAELRRRGFKDGVLLPQATTFLIPNGLPVGDPLIVDFGTATNSDGYADGIQIYSNASFTYTDTGVTGTVSVARPRNPATRTYCGITSTTGGFNWAPYIASNTMLVGTSGAINGAKAWIASNDGSATCTTAPFFDAAVFFAEAIPANGNTYKLVTIPRIDTVAVRCPQGACYIYGFVFTEEPIIHGTNDRYAIEFDECSFESFVQTYTTTAYFGNCRFDGGGGSFCNSAISFFAGICMDDGVMGFDSPGNQAHSGFDNGFLCWNSSTRVDHSAYVDFHDWMGFGGTVSYAGIRVYRQASIMIESISGTISATTYGLFLDMSARVQFGSGAVLQLVGTIPGTNDIWVGNSFLLSWADVANGVSWCGGFIGPQVI